MRGRYIFIFLLLFVLVFSVQVSAIQVVDKESITGETISSKAISQSVNLGIIISGAPALTIIFPVNNSQVVGPDILLNFTSFGADNFWYNFDHVVNISILGSITITGVGEGNYTLYLFANNSDGVNVKSVYFSVVGVIEEPTEPPGGGRCVENWQCTEWSACIDGVQTRECNDLESCGGVTDKPIEIRDCVQGFCIDGTPYGSCSINQPKYCEDGGVLENRCSECFCSAGESCFEDGDCAIACVDDNDCPIDYECKQGKCFLEEKECEDDLDCPDWKFCKQGVCTVLLAPAVPPYDEELSEIEDLVMEIAPWVLIVAIVGWIMWLILWKRRETLLEITLGDRMWKGLIANLLKKRRR